MDVLSEVLRAVRLTGAVYFDVRGRGSWVAEAPPMPLVCADVMPDAEHVIPFHMVLEGGCWAGLGDESEPPVRLETGDTVLFPHGDEHFVTAELGRRAEPNPGLFRRRTDRQLPFVLGDMGDARGERARIVCGFLGCDRKPHNPLLEALPRTMHVPSSEGRADLACELFRAALAESEAERAGGETVLAKLSELMFVQALRRYIEAAPEDERGWLSGLRDRHVGAALALIHGRPAEDWTIEGLAREVGVSRSVLAERFAHYVGDSPMRYLARWRMQLAARALERPGVSIAQAAAEVGYQSEAAFNRAFKKIVGAPPGEWRRGRKAGA